MSIRIIIVDDEPIAAKATAYMVRQNFPGAEVSGLFHSGRDAVQKAAALRPDVAIMDIEMPGINGLEAMKQIRSQVPGVKFIIISAYSNFHYAVEAMAIGASDYLLKPVRQKEFASALQKIITDIALEKEQMEHALEQQEKMELLIPMMTKDFIRSFLPGAEYDERLIACASFLGCLHSHGYVIAAEWSLGAGQGVYRDLAHHLKSSCSCFVAQVKENRAVTYIAADTTEPPPSLDWLLPILSRFDKSAMHMGVGKCYPGALQMRQSCKEAYAALEVLRKEFQSRDVRFLHIEEAAKSPCFKAADLQVFEIADTASEAQRIVDRVNRYMEENYANDITLDDVSKYVNLSPYYFSRFYKESSGMNYSDKLLRIRMERAKECLKVRNTSIKDAAYKVGYKDPNYFSKVFKKEVGITAREYRSMYQQ